MNANIENITEKPYNKCIKCPHLGSRCDGPNPLAMVNPEAENSLVRLSEWCRLRKEYLHTQDSKWINAYIAEEAQVAKATVDSFLAGKSTDVKLSSIVRIFKVLVNGTWGEYPCAIDENELEDCKKYIEELERENAQLKEKLATETEAKEKAERIARQRWEQMEAKDRQLKSMENITGERKEFMQQKDRTIKGLIIGLVVSVSLLIIALLIALATGPVI